VLGEKPVLEQTCILATTINAHSKEQIEKERERKEGKEGRIENSYRDKSTF